MNVQLGSRARQWQIWQRRRNEVIAAGVLIAVLAAVGVGLSLLWWWWAPQVDIVASPRGALVANEQPEEYISSDGRFGLIVAVAGIAAGLAVWLVRRFRGPVLLVALALGTFAGSWVMWQLGEEIGAVHGRDIAAALAMGEHARAPVVQLHSMGLLFLQPLLAVLTYVVCVSWSSTPDLRSPPVAPEQSPAEPGREPLNTTNTASPSVEQRT
jgi:hypothetical protein